MLLGGVLTTLLAEGLSYHVTTIPDILKISPNINLIVADWSKDSEEVGPKLVWTHRGGIEMTISDPDWFFHLTGCA